MIRKFANFTSTLVAVLSLVVSAQVADAQYYAGSSCCGQSSYSSYQVTSSYGYGYPSQSSYGGSVVGSLGYSSCYGGCGTPVCDTGCYGTTSYRSGCGLFGHRLFRKSTVCCDQPVGYSSYAMGYPSCAPYGGCGTYGGYAVSSGCGYGCSQAGIFGCRHRARYHGRVSSCCLLSNSYVGATAACCAPAPSISTCLSCSGNSVQPEYNYSTPAVLNPAPTPTTAAAPTPAPAPAAATTPAPAPNPAPPAEPTTDAPAAAPAPAPGN